MHVKHRQNLRATIISRAGGGKYISVSIWIEVTGAQSQITHLMMLKEVSMPQPWTMVNVHYLVGSESKCK